MEYISLVTFINIFLKKHKITGFFSLTFKPTYIYFIVSDEKVYVSRQISNQKPFRLTIFRLKVL